MAYALGLYRGFEVAAMHVEDQAAQMDSTYASIDADTISSLSGAVAGMKTAANQLRQTMTFSGNRTWGELAGRLSAVCSRPALEDEPVATLLLQVFEEMQ